MVYENKWISVKEKLPNENVFVETKIDDENGCRNQAFLRREGNLWFLPYSGMYVDYEPTHWKRIELKKIEFRNTLMNCERITNEI